MLGDDDENCTRGSSEPFLSLHVRSSVFFVMTTGGFVEVRPSRSMEALRY